MNEEFEKFVLERQSTEHELMYGLKPEDWEWQLAVVAYLAGAAAMREKCAEVADNEANGFRNTRIAAAIRKIGVE